MKNNKCIESKSLGLIGTGKMLGQPDRMLGITCDGEASHYYIQTYEHMNKRMILISYQSVIDSINKINNELLQWVINGIHEYLVTSMSNCRPQNLFAIIDRLQNFLSSIDNSLIIDGAYWLISWLLTNYPSTTHWFITVYYIYRYIQTGLAFSFKFKPLSSWLWLLTCQSSLSVKVSRNSGSDLLIFTCSAVKIDWSMKPLGRGKQYQKVLHYLTVEALCVPWRVKDMLMMMMMTLILEAIYSFSYL